MFRAYFDASGSKDEHPGVVVAGCVASVDQWERLEPDWNRILEEEGVKVIRGYRALHMKELSASRKAFEGWTPEQKARLLARLGGLMRARVSFLFGHGMPISVYHAVVATLFRNRPELAKHPLTECAARCVDEVGGWCVRNGVSGPKMTYIFEDGDPNRRELDALMADIAQSPEKSNEFRYAGWGLGRKIEVGLQAADWIAYETRLWGDRQVLPLYGERPQSRRPPRLSLEALGRIEHSIVYVADHEEFLRHFRERFNHRFGR